MEIKHNPQYDKAVVVERYSKKDGVEIQYVCTTELQLDNVLVDVFYRETPHPVFGNRYFGLFMNPFKETLMITNADMVEDLEFGIVEGDDEKLHYSEHRWAFKQFDNGNMIDGGRAYVRSSGSVKMFKVKNGEFVEVDHAS